VVVGEAGGAAGGAEAHGGVLVHGCSCRALGRSLGDGKVYLTTKPTPLVKSLWKTTRRTEQPR
jgi:hypothetical protein